jgi:hypothetical protein
MAYVIACLMAALSFLLNRRLLQSIGSVTVISCSPVLEESAKTLLPFYLGADILATHVLFGILEAGYDWYTHSADGAAAPLFSILGHSLFGVITIGCLFVSSSVWLGLSGGLLTHLLWNVTVIRLLSGGKR